jgi:hypothetical protein
MTITIQFSDNITHTYDSFEEILKLENYNDIILINCSDYNLSNLPVLPVLPNSLKQLICCSNNLSSLPELPNSLEILECGYNNISSLPELPNSLKSLSCTSNNLSNLPELPKFLEILYCSHNNLSNLPELPNSLITLCCNCNNLSSLPKLPNSLIKIQYYSNQIYFHIYKYFDDNANNYFEHQTNMKRKFINKIENWFLDCKYNPKYKYCRIRLMKEYEELYT